MGKIVGLVQLAMGVGGIGLCGYGAWLAWPPAGFVVWGALLFGVAAYGATRRAS